MCVLEVGDRGKLTVCIPNKFLGDADAAGGDQIQEPLLSEIKQGIKFLMMKFTGHFEATIP